MNGLDVSVRPARLDLDTLLYVRESIEGIVHVGGTLDPIALLDSILSVRAELLGAPDDADPKTWRVRSEDILPNGETVAEAIARLPAIRRRGDTGPMIPEREVTRLLEGIVGSETLRLPPRAGGGAGRVSVFDVDADERPRR